MRLEDRDGMLADAKNFLENKAAKKFRDWYHSWLPSQSTIFSPDRCCLSITTDQIHFVHARKADKLPELLLIESYPYKHHKDLKVILSELVRKYSLKGVRCSWILGPEHYQLLQTEALPVAPNEFQAAIRWKIKDLLRFPKEDAVIDSFPLPQAKLPTSLTMIMLVVARLSIINPIADQINASGLKLATIDIPELSFRNLTALYEKDEKSSALVYMQEEKSQLIVTNQQRLYFTRQLDFGLRPILSALSQPEDKNILEQALNTIALDLQRSFDYYQSQWRQPEPARIFLQTAVPCSVDLVALLSQRLNVTVNKINLADYFNNKTRVNLNQDGYFLPLLGGILREWEPSHATRN